MGTLPRSYIKEGKRILDWDEKRISKKFKSESPTNSLNESLFQGLLPIECLEIELLKKQKLSKALEVVLQKSLVRNIESNEQEFFFYTDGSLQLQKENRIGSSTKMGLGWLQLSEDKSNIVDEGFARIGDWPSSTRPELAAIWLVVLLAPSGTKLTIYSDSLAAINAITSINRSLAFSHFIKLGNFSIVSKIRDLVRLKGVCLNLVKVKGHSEDYWNGRADTLAKKGLTAGEELLVVPTQELSVYTTLSWKHFVIESPARKFLNLVLDLKTGAELMNAKTFRKIEPSLDESVFSWNLLWENLHELSGVRCDAMDKSKKLCTFWKCLQGKLPVLAEVGSRFPTLYLNTYCKLCNSEEVETQDHLVRCTALSNKWNLLEGTILTILLEKMKSKGINRISKSQLEDLLLGKSQEKIFQSRELLIKGLIKKDTEKRLAEISNSSAEAKIFLKFFLVAIWNSFYVEIWKPRCVFITNWEKSCGITQKVKWDLIKKKRKEETSRKKRKRKKKEPSSVKKIQEHSGLQDKVRNKVSAPLEEINDCWLDSVERFIVEGIKPNWLVS